MGRNEKLLGEPGGHEPERRLRAEQQRTSFQERQAGISENFVNQLLETAVLIRDIRRAGYPRDEGKCSAIGHTHGLGAEQVARVSEALQAQDEGDRQQLN